MRYYKYEDNSLYRVNEKNIAWAYSRQSHIWVKIESRWTRYDTILCKELNEAEVFVEVL